MSHNVIRVTQLPSATFNRNGFSIAQLPTVLAILPSAPYPAQNGVNIGTIGKEYGGFNVGQFRVTSRPASWRRRRYGWNEIVLQELFSSDNGSATLAQVLPIGWHGNDIHRDIPRDRKVLLFGNLGNAGLYLHN